MTEFEELPEPRGKQRRLRIDIAVGALVLLLIVLVFRATTQHHGKPAAAIGSSAPATPIGGFGTPPDSGSGLLAGLATGAVARSLPTGPDADPTICPPSHPACSRTEYLPRAVVVAIQTVYPTAQVQSCYTLRLTGRPDGLRWFRQISASIQGKAVVIQLQAPPPTGNPVPNGRSGITTFYSATLGGYFVSIESDWQGSPGSELATLAKLASDRRLLAD